MLALVGDHWLGTSKLGHARVFDPTDFVRMEIESAFDHGASVLPVLIGLAHMPPAHELPASLSRFAEQQAMTLDIGRDFEHHMERIVSRIEEIVRGHRFVKGTRVKCGRAHDGSIDDNEPCSPQAPAHRSERELNERKDTLLGRIRDVMATYKKPLDSPGAATAAPPSATEPAVTRVDPPMLAVTTGPDGNVVEWCGTRTAVVLQRRPADLALGSWQTVYEGTAVRYFDRFLIRPIEARFRPSYCYRAKAIGVAGMLDESVWSDEVVA